MTSYEIVTWGDSVGDHWPCLVRVFNPATFPDGFPVRWSDLAPGVDLARASWESATGRSYRSGVGASLAPWEPEEGPECPHSRVPLMRVLLALATGAVWVGQWDGYGGRRRPSPAQHLTTHKGVLRSYDVVEVTEELRRALEDPADPPMLPNRMWDEGGHLPVGRRHRPAEHDRRVHRADRGRHRGGPRPGERSGRPSRSAQTVTLKRGQGEATSRAEVGAGGFDCHAPRRLPCPAATVTLLATIPDPRALQPPLTRHLPDLPDFSSTTDPSMG